LALELAVHTLFRAKRAGIEPARTTAPTGILRVLIGFPVTVIILTVTELVLRFFTTCAFPFSVLAHIGTRGAFAGTRIHLFREIAARSTLSWVYQILLLIAEAVTVIVTPVT
jgi:hypothetical protein